MDKKDILKNWDSILNLLKENVNNDLLFNDFKNQVHVVDFHDHVIYFKVNEELKVIVEKNLAQTLNKLLDQYFNTHFQLVFLDPEQLKTYKEEIKDAQVTSGKLEGVNPKYSLDDYVLGQFNRSAILLFKKIIETNDISHTNPIFLYGSTGLGKTHLVMGFANSYHKAYPHKNIIYITAEQFIKKVLENLGKREQDLLWDDSPIENFKKEMGNFDVFIIDDIQYLSDKLKTNEIFFNIFNALINEDKLVIITSDASPDKLRGFHERMISRFASGITLKIDLPEPEALKNILNKFLNTAHLKLTDNAIDFAIHYYNNDIRKLLGLANNIIISSSLNGQEIFDDQDLKMLLDLQANTPNDLNKEKYKIENLISTVAKMFSIKVSDLTGKSRKSEIVNARHIAIYILRKHFNLPLKTIGNFFGSRNHSTIKSSYDKIEEKIQKEPDFSNTINQIIKQI